MTSSEKCMYGRVEIAQGSSINLQTRHVYDRGRHTAEDSDYNQRSDSKLA